MLLHALQWGSSFFLFAMAHSDTIDQIAERVDHLLLRHEELQRTNALLTQQVQALSLERDQLKSRLAAARARGIIRLTAVKYTTPSGKALGKHS